MSRLNAVNICCLRGWVFNGFLYWTSRFEINQWIAEIWPFCPPKDHIRANHNDISNKLVQHNRMSCELPILWQQSFTAWSLVMGNFVSFLTVIFQRKTKSDKLQSPCRKMSSPCGLGTSNLASSVSSLNRDSLEHSPSHSLPDSGFSPTGSSQSSLSNSIDFSPTLKNEHSSFSTDVALGLEVDSKPYLSHESGKYFGIRSKRPFSFNPWNSPLPFKMTVQFQLFGSSTFIPNDRFS